MGGLQTVCAPERKKTVLLKWHGWTLPLVLLGGTCSHPFQQHHNRATSSAATCPASPCCCLLPAPPWWHLLPVPPCPAVAPKLLQHLLSFFTYCCPPNSPCLLPSAPPSQLNPVGRKANLVRVWPPRSVSVDVMQS